MIDTLNVILDKSFMVLLVIIIIKNSTIGGNCNLHKYWKNKDDYRKRYKEWIDRIP